MPEYSCFGKYEDLELFLDNIEDAEELGYSNLIGELRILIDMDYNELKKIAAEYNIDIIWRKL